MICSSPNPEEESLTAKHNISKPKSTDDNFDIPKEVDNLVFQFQKKQKRGGTIDVWWLYDDGGMYRTVRYYRVT